MRQLCKKYYILEIVENKKRQESDLSFSETVLRNCEMVHKFRVEDAKYKKEEGRFVATLQRCRDLEPSLIVAFAYRPQHGATEEFTKGQLEFYKLKEITRGQVDDIMFVDNFLLLGENEDQTQEKHKQGKHALFNVFLQQVYVGYDFYMHFGKYHKALHQAGINSIIELDLQSWIYLKQLRTDKLDLNCTKQYTRQTDGVVVTQYCQLDKKVTAHCPK